MAQIALDTLVARRNRRGRFTDRFFFHLFVAGLTSALPALLLFTLLAWLQPLRDFFPFALPARLAVAFSLLIALTLLFSWFSNRHLATLISALSRASIRIGDGDWGQRAPMRGPVEFRTLAYRLNASAEMLQGLHSAVLAGSDELGTATKEQIETTTLTKSRAASLASAAHASKQHAERVVALATSTHADLKQAGRDFQTYLAHNAEEATRVNQVKDILALINGVTAQTKLLALNAAIEAERAGAQGRGLAAIAEEIRLLAEDSKQKSLDIAQVLATVDSARTEVVSDLARAAEQLEVSLNSMREVTSASEQVQKTSAKQLEASDQVSQDMEQIAFGAQRIDNIARQISAEHLFRHRERRK